MKNVSFILWKKVTGFLSNSIHNGLPVHLQRTSLDLMHMLVRESGCRLVIVPHVCKEDQYRVRTSSQSKSRLKIYTVRSYNILSVPFKFTLVLTSSFCFFLLLCLPVLSQSFVYHFSHWWYKSLSSLTLICSYSTSFITN